MNEDIRSGIELAHRQIAPLFTRAIVLTLFHREDRYARRYFVDILTRGGSHQNSDEPTGVGGRWRHDAMILSLLIGMSALPAKCGSSSHILIDIYRPLKL